MSEEKALEYQQVAGLLCLDIDVLAKIVDKSPSISKEDLIWQVRDLVSKKNEMIKSKKVRTERYAAASLLFSVSRRG